MSVNSFSLVFVVAESSLSLLTSLCETSHFVTLSRWWCRRLPELSSYLSELLAQDVVDDDDDDVHQRRKIGDSKCLNDADDIFKVDNHLFSHIIWQICGEIWRKFIAHEFNLIGVQYNWNQFQQHFWANVNPLV